MKQVGLRFDQVVIGERAGGQGDTTQITLRSDLLFQIRDSIVVIRDRIHNELKHTIGLSSYVVNLG